MDIIFSPQFLNGLLMIVLPVALGSFLVQRFKLSWRLWGIGAATFILSQVGHIPFNYGVGELFNLGLLPLPPTAWLLPLKSLALGLSAGLWESWARYFAYRLWAKDARSWRKGLLLGAGHGGIEALILGVLVLVAFFYMASLRSADLGKLVPPDQVTVASQQVEQYWAAAWPDAMLGALERSFTLIFHLAASILVLQAFLRQRIVWVWLAVGWHALMDGGAVYVVGNWGAYPAEVWIGGGALLSLGIIFLLRTPEPEADAPPQAATLTPSEPAAPVADLSAALGARQPEPETDEKLDDSRFTE